MGQLKFKDLYLGKIDAYNEFLEFGPEVCSEIFFEYPNLDFGKMVDGSVYYICGDKGTGKTMLLKYIEARMQQSEDPVFTEFVRFKKDVDEDQRNQIKRASLPSQPFEEIVEKNIPTDITINCVLAWQIYLIKLIVLEKRIQYSEIKAGLVPTGNVWQEYFVQTIGNSRIDVRNYILDQTWYKPRDIIRMFTAIQAVRGEKSTADQETFDTIRKDYSDESWTEFEESLTAKYSNIEVDGIR